MAPNGCAGNRPVRTRAQWQEAWAQAAQWARTPGDAERRYEVALIPIDGWQVFYYRGGAWSNALSSAGTTQSTRRGGQGADPSSAIPEGIRLQLTLSPGGALSGQLVRDWVNPRWGGRRTLTKPMAQHPLTNPRAAAGSGGRPCWPPCSPVTLVATLAASAMWQQWRAVEVETAERGRVQSALDSGGRP